MNAPDSYRLWLSNWSNRSRMLTMPTMRHPMMPAPMACSMPITLSPARMPSRPKRNSATPRQPIANLSALLVQARTVCTIGFDLESDSTKLT
jgi:hypothetical protein